MTLVGANGSLTVYFEGITCSHEDRNAVPCFLVMEEKDGSAKEEEFHFSRLVPSTDFISSFARQSVHHEIFPK
jgi:hypothetical protein